MGSGQPRRHDSRQGRALTRFRLLLDAYGLPLAQRREVAGAILDNHDWCCAIITDAANAGHPGFADYWSREISQPKTAPF